MTTTLPGIDGTHDKPHDYRWYRQQALAHVQSTDIAALAAEGLLPSPNETYLTGAYPPLKATRPITAKDVFRGATLLLNIYRHIPFCRQRCTFCHFAKEIRPGSDRIRAYLEALVAEMVLVRRLLERRSRVASVYFGGDTSSFLTPDEMELVFAALHENFLIGPETEVTFELHPQVADDPGMAAQKLGAMALGGVNRIAFGAHTLNDRVLRMLNRGHAARQVFDLLDILADAGMSNVSVDLMYGLPYETPDGWYSTVTRLVDHGVSKLNIFPLFLKATDPISSLYVRKPHLFPGTDERLAAHSLAESVLFDRGFRRGPVLYYSLAEHHSRQQESKFDCFDEVNLLGLGVSAFGYLGHTQYYNVCDVDSYVTAVGRGHHPVWQGITLSEEEVEPRAAMFGLSSTGIDRESFMRRFGRSPEDGFPDLAGLESHGLLRREGDVWAVTDLGAYCIDGMTRRFASADVAERVEQTNTTLASHATARRSVVILLGATGRLAPEVAGSLRFNGLDVIRVARRPEPGVDVTGVDTRRAPWWRPEAWAGVVDGHDVLAIINLVAGRDRRTEQAISAGIGAIRAMIAIRDAARAHGSYPSTVHVGSVAEAREGTRSTYAIAKRAARAEALRLGVSAVVTLAIVPRAAGDPADRLLRLASSLAPALAVVPVAVSPAREVGEALARIVLSLRGDASEPCGTMQIVLAAQLRPLSEVVGAAPRERWCSGMIVAGATRLPATGLAGLDRLATFARMSRQPEPTAPAHYLAGVPHDDLVPTSGAESEPCSTYAGTGLGLFRRRRPDALGEHWFLPRGTDNPGGRQ